jgi:OmcA/MtrC family decaheme c-type cytochrome
VPDGSAVTTVRDVVRTETCNKCHLDMGFHGGSRKSVEVCILCHQPQTTDPDTGNTVDMTVMIHKVHMGLHLPSVVAGTPYRIIGNSQNVHDYSTVGFPDNPNNCATCHDGKGAQSAIYSTAPSRRACGACHDDVNFASGEKHLNLPQVSDNLCANCHLPEGEIEYDASIKGAHLNSSFSRQLPGTTFISRTWRTMGRVRSPG